MNQSENPIMEGLLKERSFNDTEIFSRNSHFIGKSVNRVLRIIVLSAGIITILIGLVTLIGQATGNDIFRKLNSSIHSMRANTAVCLILLACMLIIKEFSSKHKMAGILFRIIILIISSFCIITLFEYLFNWNSGIDELLFSDSKIEGYTLFPGRLSFNTAICFLLLGFALFFVDTKSKSLLFISQIFPLVSILLCIFPILGYLNGSKILLLISFSNHMSLYTAISLMALSMGVICLPHSGGFLSILTVNGPGGYMARRLLPLTVAVPVAFIWIRLFANSGVSGSRSVDVIIISFLYIGIFAFFIWKTARAVNSIDLERLNAQRALKQSEQIFHSALDNMMEGCQLIGFDWKFLYINKTAEIHNRRPSADLIGKSYIESWPDIEKTEVFKKIKDCMDNRVYHVMKNEFAFSDGSKGWFDLRIQQVPEGIFILSTDITEQVLDETHNLLANEILEHINRYNETEIMITSIIESIKEKTGFEAIGIRIKDGEDFPYYKTAGFCDEFVKSERFLCSRDEKGNIIRDENNKPLLDCMCGNILCGRVEASKSFFTSGGSFRSNNTSLLLATTTNEDRMARTRNYCNSAGYESVALIPLRSGNKIIGLLQLNDHRKDLFNASIIPFFETLGSSIGIAIMRNKAENELKNLNIELEKRVSERTEQLLDSNKELESFAYSVSHDLRAPLRHVIGFSEILEEELEKGMDIETKRLTGKIKGSAIKMGRLIDELLNYSRHGKTDLKTKLLQLNPIIQDVITEANDIIKDRNITWKINKLPDVRADQTLIRLVFQNFINNSIKFTSKKESASIEIGSEENHSGEYTFYIKDNGAGFDMEYVNKLFGVFQRLHTTEEFEGTGIGLATVRRIVRRHGGKVWAEGSIDEGATFFFTLPK